MTVTVANGSLPPPYGAPRSRRFTSAAALRRVTRALNTYRIARRRAVRASGCVGGYEVTITVVPRRGRTVHMGAYRCGGRTSGTIAGDLPRFLVAIGIRPPA